MSRRTKAQRAYELAKEIMNLEAVLRSKRAEFERLVGDAPVQLSLPLRPPESCPHRVRAVVAASADRALAFHEIVAQIEGVRSETVRATLSKLISAKEVERAGPGLYRATPRLIGAELQKTKGGA